MRLSDGKKRFITLASLSVGVIALYFIVGLYARNKGILSNIYGSKMQQTIAPTPIVPAASNSKPTEPPHDAVTNPLSGKSFYIDHARPVVVLAEHYRQTNQDTEAKLLDKIAQQPGTTWLTGPSPTDSTASHDIAEVVRTSSEAAVQHAVPIYVLYAIPNRDACAGYSKGGFPNAQEYSGWINAVKTALQSEAIIILEPDAIAHTVAETCFSSEQRAERYLTLKNTVSQLGNDKHVLAVYIDVGNPEWMADYKKVVEPLKKSGVDNARGIAVNISSFVSSKDAAIWSQKLLAAITGDKGAVIDTSRNGIGVPDNSVTGIARWCNPKGRGIGNKPTTGTNTPQVDAYIWGKNIGESDGDCFGYPPAGQFVPSLALDLARNSIAE